MLRYMRRLEARDLSLTHAMIPLGSCTMKLNATAEMMPVTWPEWGRAAPVRARRADAGLPRAVHAAGADAVRRSPASPATSLQPNAGSQGEYAGLLVIRAYHESRGQGHRNVCLIPSSAHGTNPASAVMAGYQVVVVACDDGGNVDLADLQAKAARAQGHAGGADGDVPVDARRVRGGDQRDLRHRPRARRPGVHGRREPERAGRAVPPRRHRRGRLPHQPAQDVLHPARRRRPGHGADRVAAHLAPFLPGHPVVATGGGKRGIGPVSAAPWGSASILLDLVGLHPDDGGRRGCAAPRRSRS